MDRGRTRHRAYVVSFTPAEPQFTQHRPRKINNRIGRAAHPRPALRRHLHPYRLYTRAQPRTPDPRTPSARLPPRLPQPLPPENIREPIGVLRLAGGDVFSDASREACGCERALADGVGAGEGGDPERAGGRGEECGGGGGVGARRDGVEGQGDAGLGGDAGEGGVSGERGDSGC